MLFQENKISCSKSKQRKWIPTSKRRPFWGYYCFTEDRNSMDFPCSAWTRFLNRIFYISWRISHRHSYKRFWKTWYYFHSTHLALLRPFRSIRENIFSKFFQNNFQSFFFKIKLRVLLKSDLSILSPLRSKFHAGYEFGIPFNAIDCLPCSSKNFPSDRILTRLLFMENICHRDMISLIENNTCCTNFSFV